MTLTLPRLHAGQREIKSNARRFNVINCGRRFGKSLLGEDVAIGPALQGYPVGWFSPDYKSLLEVWREVCQILRPVIARKSEQEKRIDLITGGVIEFWALDADPECSRGRKYKRVIVDEAAKVRELMRAWLQAIRANLADYEGDAWFFSTPKGRNDYWELYQRGKNPDLPDWACWKMPTGVNPYIKPHEIEAMRSEMGHRVASQEIDAEFLEVGGRFFDEWDEDRHTIIDRDVPRWWTPFGGLDYGTAAPFSFHLAASDDQGGIDVCGEVYKPGLLPTDQAALVVALIEAKGWPRGLPLIAADPSMFPPKDPAKRLGEYPIEAFWRAGLNCVPAVNDRQAGWTRAKEWQHVPGKPAAVRIHKGACPNLVRTTPLMTYDERPGHEEDLDTTQEDHACDSFWRYALMTRPRPAKTLPKPDYILQYRDEQGNIIEEGEPMRNFPRELMPAPQRGGSYD